MEVPSRLYKDPVRVVTGGFDGIHHIVGYLAYCIGFGTVIDSKGSIAPAIPIVEGVFPDLQVGGATSDIDPHEGLGIGQVPVNGADDLISFNQDAVGIAHLDAPVIDCIGVKVGPDGVVGHLDIDSLASGNPKNVNTEFCTVDRIVVQDDVTKSRITGNVVHCKTLGIV